MNDTRKTSSKDLVIVGVNRTITDGPESSQVSVAVRGCRCCRLLVDYYVKTESESMRPNSMILSPLDILNPHPSYFISVNSNCFTPSSYITTVRHDSWESEVIGEFEWVQPITGMMHAEQCPRMGLTTSKKPSSVYIRSNERLLSDILNTSYRPFPSCFVRRHLFL